MGHSHKTTHSEKVKKKNNFLKKNFLINQWSTIILFTTKFQLNTKNNKLMNVSSREFKRVVQLANGDQEKNLPCQILLYLAKSSTGETIVGAEIAKQLRVFGTDEREK